MNTEGHHRTCECNNCEEYFEILKEVAEKTYGNKQNKLMEINKIKEQTVDELIPLYEFFKNKMRVFNEIKNSSKEADEGREVCTLAITRIFNELLNRTF
jgi:ribonuclease I